MVEFVMAGVVAAQFALGYLTFRAARKAAKHAQCVHVGDLPELRKALRGINHQVSDYHDELDEAIKRFPKSRKRAKAEASTAAQ